MCGIEGSALTRVSKYRVGAMESVCVLLAALRRWREEAKCAQPIFKFALHGYGDWDISPLFSKKKFEDASSLGDVNKWKNFFH
jgi:hypothetical protein